ncbi:MAG: VanZ family protein [Candidatus Mariimomonas ferrooxydans]
MVEVVWRERVKNVSQYIWLFICAGLYVYFVLQLRRHPEEAIHFIEYGLLSYFLFRALSQKIRDQTIYLTALLFVLFIGMIDEFLQWMIPDRYWDFKDVGLNSLAGGIFLLAVWKSIRPEIIYGPVKKISVKMLAGIIAVDLILLGLCLSNTPGFVNRYTAAFNTLSWLRNEEPMTEYGYKYKDPEIGTFYSRFTLEKLREIDIANSETYGEILLQDISSDFMHKKFIRIYNPNTNPFLYEFMIHLYRREHKFYLLAKTDKPDRKIRMSSAAFRENLLIEKYFGNTLKHSGFVWPDEKAKDLEKTASLWKGDYISKSGFMIITYFSLKEALLAILTILIMVWISGRVWKRRFDI